ncbi:50S ribosomal protein L4 [Candidatus Daviesbacteria bacterium]|nr:50S ribosomal protein L4 [Candidatus Daviesbacteria bacterium]
MPRVKKESSISTRATSNLSIPVYTLSGQKSTTTLTLPKDIFGAKVNKQLLSQAIRVYTTNQKQLNGSTKTRGEVVGSTAKIYRQKGTGRARHGAIRAPIFVGGGIVFGPKSRKVRLDLPKKMKKAALFSALSSKAKGKEVLGISGTDKASGKTKEIARLMQKLAVKSALIVTDKKQDNLARAVKNIPGVDVLPINLINALDVLKHARLLLTKDALEGLKK